MNYRLYIVSILSVLFLSLSGAFAQDLSEGRALSLRVLQKRLEACQADGSCPQKLLQLAGIKRIKGYVADQTNNDLILVGQTDKNLPPLHTEDFVVALRNAWVKYYELKGHTRIYSDPGCSIDPVSEVNQRLKRLGNKIQEGSYPGGREKGIEAWHKICRSPQNVRIDGIPFSIHFADVMVKADYHMKKLVDGSELLEIPGFMSLIDMTMAMARKDIVKEKPLSIPSMSMNRFWFYPGKNLYKEDTGVVIIAQSPVILLTEEEYLDEKGKRTGKGRPSPLAQKFAEAFTARYDEIAQKRTIYRELENLFHCVALAKILKFKKPFNAVGMDLDYFLNGFEVPHTTVNHQLPGRSSVKRLEHRKDTARGYRVYKLWIPSCGGVGINIQVNAGSFVQDDTGKLLGFKKRVLASRTSSNALFWDFPVKEVNN